MLLNPEVSLPLILLAFCVYLSIASPYFLLWQNFMNIFASVSVIGIAAAFATLVVISAGVDLTPVAVMTAVGIVSLHTLNNGWSVTTTVIACLCPAARGRCRDGLLMSLIALNPFITTLGTNFLHRGRVRGDEREVAGDRGALDSSTSAKHDRRATYRERR